VAANEITNVTGFLTYFTMKEHLVPTRFPQDIDNDTLFRQAADEGWDRPTSWTQWLKTTMAV
jgi:hypothetical protein